MASSTASAQKRPFVTIVVASMMLFSMFFGAGNLIFPPVLGAESGQNYLPAIIGFLLTGVALPVLGVLAIALSGQDVLDLSQRGGRLFGIVFPVLLYLSIGAFYALPRTAAVSFSTAVTPVFGWTSWGASAVFCAVFFGVSLVLSLNPSSIVDTLGKFLTPVLILLLALLIVLGITLLKGSALTPTAEYAEHPLSAGFINGYMTMDSLAALAFGIVVVSSLSYKGFASGRQLTRGVSLAGVIAGLFLGLVYVGLGIVGVRVLEGRSYSDGAVLLADVAYQTMGTAGGVVFGLIVLLACLTTSVGLLGATSEFFNRLVPQVSYRWWVIIFSVIAFGVATLGLENVLKVAAPIIGLLYPAAIVLILLTLIESVLPMTFNWAFKLGLTVAVLWSVAMTLVSLGVTSLDSLISWAPGSAQDLGWTLPTLVAVVVGFVLDRVRPVAD